MAALLDFAKMAVLLVKLDLRSLKQQLDWHPRPNIPLKGCIIHESNDLPRVNVQTIAISIIRLEYQALTVSLIIFAIHTFVFCITYD